MKPAGQAEEEQVRADKQNDTHTHVHPSYRESVCLSGPRRNGEQMLPEKLWQGQAGELLLGRQHLQLLLAFALGGVSFALACCASRLDEGIEVKNATVVVVCARVGRAVIRHSAQQQQQQQQQGGRGGECVRLAASERKADICMK